jgi:hypothetical protein
MSEWLNWYGTCLVLHEALNLSLSATKKKKKKKKRKGRQY